MQITDGVSAMIGGSCLVDRNRLSKLLVCIMKMSALGTFSSIYNVIPMGKDKNYGWDDSYCVTFVVASKMRDVLVAEIRYALSDGPRDCIMDTMTFTNDPTGATATPSTPRPSALLSIRNGYGNKIAEITCKGGATMETTVDGILVDKRYIDKYGNVSLVLHREVQE